MISKDEIKKFINDTYFIINIKITKEKYLFLIQLVFNNFVIQLCINEAFFKTYSWKIKLKNIIDKEIISNFRKDDINVKRNKRIKRNDSKRTC